MGDRTSVTLTVLTSQAEAAEAFFDEDAVGDSEESGDFSFFHFYEVNYGELVFLDDLSEAGIAYISAWDGGAEFSSGNHTCRFTPEGEMQCKSHYAGDENPPIKLLLPMIDAPEALRQYILDYVATSAVLPWDDQKVYGARYRMRQLVTS